jgi:Ca-activated chloride channel family protein
LQLIREKRKTGVTLTVLGYGIGNLNDGMMEAVSNAGNGIYGVISSAEHARAYVSNHMLSTLVHIAKDVKIQVEFNPDTVHAYRLLGYENRAIADQDFRNDVVDAGEIGAGHRVTALYELVLAGGAVPERAGAPAVSAGMTSELKREVAAEDLVLVKVRWKGVDATEVTPAQETSAALATRDISDGVAAADPDLQWAAAVASLAEVLKRSPYADAKQLPAIRQIVEAQAARDEGRTEFAALLAKVLPRLPSP